MMAGYIFLDITYGILMVTSGFPVWLPVLTAAVIYTGSMEFLMAEILASSFNPIAIMNKKRLKVSHAKKIEESIHTSSDPVKDIHTSASPTESVPDESTHVKSIQKKSASEKKSTVLRKLFFATLYLSAFTFGGGYVIVTLLKQKFVDELHWIDEEEMLDLVAIAQSSPGAIAVNGAIVVGYKLAGISGVLVSVFGAILPPFIILTVISFFYDAFKSNFVVQAVLKGMNAGVAAVIISVVFDMGTGIVKARDGLLTAVMILSFVLNYFLKVNVVWIILFAAGFGAIMTLIREHCAKCSAESASKNNAPE